MPTIVLTEQHTESHPDYAAIHEWLEANEIDPMWLRLPSTIAVDIDKETISYTAYLHEGTVITTVPNGAGGRIPVTVLHTIPAKRWVLPALRLTTVNP